MSSRSWNPLNSVATTASARTWSSASVVSTTARLCPAIAAVPWPITTTRRMLPSRSRARTDSGSVSVPSATVRPAVALDHLAAQRLAERRRRLRDLLEQEVRELAAVDVARRDLGVLQLALVHRQRRAVERVSLDAGERARLVRVEHHHLAASGGGALGIGRGLAVHAQVGGRLLDQAVGLAGDDVGVLDHADVEGLAAAPERQEQAVGRGGGLGRDAHRARELRHGRAEGVFHCRRRSRCGERRARGSPWRRW